MDIGGVLAKEIERQGVKLNTNLSLALHDMHRQSLTLLSNNKSANREDAFVTLDIEAPSPAWQEPCR